jgi:hypothetical protein
MLSPATDVWTMALIDLPLCVGTTGSLAMFYGMAERSQGGSPSTALRRLPALIALGMGMAPYLTRAVWDGLGSMAGEFVRTPKKGLRAGRYSAYTCLPLPEVGLCTVSCASVVAAIETGHWFAAPFAALFAFGYGYVATLVMREQTARRRASLTESSALLRAAE